MYLCMRPDILITFYAILYQESVELTGAPILGPKAEDGIARDCDVDPPRRRRRTVRRRDRRCLRARVFRGISLL